MENNQEQHYCFLCNGKFNESNLRNTSSKYICTQCAHFRNVCRAIFYPLMGITFVLIKVTLLDSFTRILWELNHYDFYDSGASLRVMLLSGLAHVILFFLLLSLTRYLVKTVTKSLSINKYRAMGKVIELQDTPISIENTPTTNIRKAYIEGEYKKTSEEEKYVIEQFRAASDTVREEILMILSLEPIPEKKKQKYKGYSMQEASIILTYRNSSKTIQNTVKQKLHITEIPKGEIKQSLTPKTETKKFIINAEEKSIILAYRNQSKETQSSVCKILAVNYQKERRNSGSSNDKLLLSKNEIKIIESFRKNPDMQPAVKTLLGF